MSFPRYISVKYPLNLSHGGLVYIINLGHRFAQNWACKYPSIRRCKITHILVQFFFYLRLFCLSLYPYDITQKGERDTLGLRGTASLTIQTTGIDFIFTISLWIRSDVSWFIGEMRNHRQLKKLRWNTWSFAVHTGPVDGGLDDKVRSCRYTELSQKVKMCHYGIRGIVCK